MYKKHYIFILSASLFFLLSGCSIFNNRQITGGETITNYTSKLTKNELIEIGNSQNAKIFGKFIVNTDDETQKQPNIIIINLANEKAFGTQADFDGSYSIQADSGTYDMLVLNELVISNLKLVDGEVRHLNFEFNIGSSSTVTYVYKNKRAWRKVNRRKRKAKKAERIEERLKKEYKNL